MEAQLIGELVLVDGCLRVNASESDISYLPVWPPDFVLSTEIDTIQILNGEGQVVLRLGQEVRIGGGEIPGSAQAAFEQMYAELPNDQCSGPYWVVGDVPQ